MNFQDRAKFVFADSIKELMKDEALDKITVSQIAGHCGTTRQTFYRYFKDKYELVTWYFDIIVQKAIYQMGKSMTLQEGLEKKFTFMREDKAFFISAFSSGDYNSLLAYDYRCILAFYTAIAESNSAGPLPDDIAFLLEFYCHGSMDQTMAWAQKGMTLEPEKMAAMLVEAMPQRLGEYLNDLSMVSPE